MSDDPRVERLLAAVRAGAADALRTGAARLEVTTIAALYGAEAVYDGPVVVLTPRHTAAAGVVVEPQGEWEWWLTAGGGPGFEYSGEPGGAGGALLASLVAAVVGGGYEHHWEHRRQRLLLRPWRTRTLPVWVASFMTDAGVLTTAHVGLDPAPEQQAPTEFEPYR